MDRTADERADGHDAEDIGPPTLSESELRTSLERSLADIAAGPVLPVDKVVLAELDAAIERTKARRLPGSGDPPFA